LRLAKKISENTVFLILGRICVGALQLLVTALLARYLGVSEYGRYVFALTYVTFFTVLCIFGVDTVLTREMARNSFSASHLLGCGMLIKTFFSSASLIIALIIAFSLNLPGETQKILYLISLSLLFNIFLTPKVVFEAYLKAKYLVAVEFMGKIITLGLVYFGILSRCGLVALVIIILFSDALGLVMLSWLSRRFVKPIFTFDLKMIAWLVKESTPVAVMGIFIITYLRLNTILLAFIKGDAAVGYFNGAYNIVMSLALLPDAYARSVFPVMSDFFKLQPDNLYKIFTRSFKYLASLAILVISLGMLLADDIVTFILGKAFYNSIDAFRILIFAGGISFISNLVSTTLTAINRQKTNMRLAFMAVVINVVLNLMLIPRYSYIGAGIATVATEGMGCLFALMVNMQYFKIRLLSSSHLRYLRLLAAAALMVLLVKNLPKINFLVTAVLAIAVYFILLLFFRWFDKEDRKIVRQILEGNK
jgi:O-antigen/teichoic acid export membrane protein